ncbi:hypothetical protein [Chitinimonas koreensis]|uniref:hypothetical protein n=1 Tax=Chitinimonas koreensis TaxID=356302 RepID=UPI001654ABF7|nr:hypothetical protein [Chitinimonas koreensis]QNM95239.1 hypothetical protein H9L41_15315 [Chitinimonas koreensis]
MYTDFFAALQAGIQAAPITVARQADGWYLYNPTTPPGEDDAPHVLVDLNGVLVPLNSGGSQVLCTLAMTGAMPEGL